MKVKFLPDGGFDKNGAFVEYNGDEPLQHAPQYQRQGFIKFDAICKELHICSNFAVKDAGEDPKSESSDVNVFLSGDANIEDDLHGKWRLSFLGQEREHDCVKISLHKSCGREKVYFGGHYWEADEDSEGVAEFFLEAHIPAERFELVQKEMSQPYAELHLRINPAVFSDFYATWSPINSDGRVIKFLNHVRDVENHEDIPADFNLADIKRELRSEESAEPIYLYVRRSLRASCTEEILDADQESENKAPSDVPLSPSHPEEASSGSPQLARTTERLASRVSALLWVATAIGILMLLRLAGGLA